MAPKPKTIFILEDDASFSIVFKRWLEDAGYHTVTADSVDQAQKMLSEMDSPPDLFWIDYYLQARKPNGMDFFRWLRRNRRFLKIPAIMVSITIDAEKLSGFEKQGIAKTFSKTVTERDQIIKGVKKILGE